MQQRTISPFESSSLTGGIAAIFASCWASEVVTKARDQCTIVVCCLYATLQYRIDRLLSAPAL